MHLIFSSLSPCKKWFIYRLSEKITPVDVSVSETMDQKTYLRKFRRGSVPLAPPGSACVIWHWLDSSVFWTWSSSNQKMLANVLNRVRPDNFQKNVSEPQLTCGWTWSTNVQLSIFEASLASWDKVIATVYAVSNKFFVLNINKVTIVFSLRTAQMQPHIIHSD